eukprot:jgi/Botrbrau1/4531/Bobra.60_2s0020.1
MWRPHLEKGCHAGASEAWAVLGVLSTLWVHGRAVPGQVPQPAVSPDQEVLLGLPWATRLGWANASLSLPVCPEAPSSLHNASSLSWESCDQWESGNSSWPHIFCNHQRRVIALCLGGTGCNGPLPEQLGKLTYLAMLDLSNKGTSGTLHSNWTFLTDPATENLLDPQQALARAEFATLNLNLSRYELSGTVPAECCNLTQLEQVIRLRNIINGTLPAAWSQLAHLTYLRLSYNHLNGSLPSAWGNLTELKALGLFENKLTGPLPRSWSGMRALMSVYLSNNSISGTLPSEWGNLTRLAELHLDLNRVSGPLPSTWGRGMSSVLGLHMSDNGLSGTLPSEWGNLTLLEKLHMNQNRLRGSLPRSWGWMGALRELKLSNNSLSGYLPRDWGSLARLEVLELDSNNLTGPLRAEWSGMGALQSLDLYTNRLSGTLPHEWSNLTQILNLDLSDNRVSGTLPETWEAMEGLQWLNLASNELSGGLLAGWGSFAQLITLSLGSNRLGGALPGAWANLTQLTWLDLSRNNLTGGLPREWAQMGSLQILDMTINGLTGTLPSEWAVLQMLSFLELSTNALSGSLPAVWANLTSLAGIRMAQNDLSGPLPDDWGSLSSLIVLDLSHNSLDGTLPSSWGNLTGGMLNLQGNRLKGTLPGNMSISPLVVLLLSGNALTGALPEEWEAPGLQVLSVGNNRLQPPVPNGWWNGTSFPKITLLDVGGLMRDTAGGKGWKGQVCRDAAVFQRDNPKKLASIVAQNLFDALPVDIDMTANIFSDLNLENLLLSIPTDSFDSIEELCKNKDVATLLGSLWGTTFGFLVLGTLLHWVVAPHWDRIFGTGNDFSILAELAAAVMASLYWYDWVTDMLVIIEVWEEKWAKWLLAFALLNYGISGFILIAHLFKSEAAASASESSKSQRTLSFVVWWVLIVTIMPILDTVAVVQLLLKDWNVHLIEVRIDNESYLHMRDVVKAVCTAIPTAILTSLTFAIGTRPDQGVVYTTSTFVASICGSMMLVVWAWFVALYHARAPGGSDGKPTGLFAHLRRVFMGETLQEDEPEPAPEGAVEGRERSRMMRLIRIWQAAATKPSGSPASAEDPQKAGAGEAQNLPAGADAIPKSASYEGLGGASKLELYNGDGAVRRYALDETGRAPSSGTMFDDCDGVVWIDALEGALESDDLDDGFGAPRFPSETPYLSGFEQGEGAPRYAGDAADTSRFNERFGAPRFPGDAADTAGVEGEDGAPRFPGDAGSLAGSKESFQAVPRFASEAPYPSGLDVGDGAPRFAGDWGPAQTYGDKGIRADLPRATDFAEGVYDSNLVPHSDHVGLDVAGVTASGQPWWKSRLRLALRHVRETSWRVCMLLLRALVVLGPAALAIVIEFYK